MYQAVAHPITVPEKGSKNIVWIIAKTLTMMTIFAFIVHGNRQRQNHVVAKVNFAFFSHFCHSHKFQLIFRLLLLIWQMIKSIPVYENWRTPTNPSICRVNELNSVHCVNGSTSEWWAISVAFTPIMKFSWHASHQAWPNHCWKHNYLLQSDTWIHLECNIWKWCAHFVTSSKISLHYIGAATCEHTLANTSINAVNALRCRWVRHIAACQQQNRNAICTRWAWPRTYAFDAITCKSTKRKSLHTWKSNTTEIKFPSHPWKMNIGRLCWYHHWKRSEFKPIQMLMMLKVCFTWFIAFSSKNDQMQIGRVDL